MKNKTSTTNKLGNNANLLLSAGRHKWENLNTSPKGFRCTKCGIEKYQMRYGWQYEWVDNGIKHESYEKQPCR